MTDVDLNIILLLLSNLRKASYGAFFGKTLFYVFGSGLKCVNVGFGVKFYIITLFFFVGGNTNLGTMNLTEKNYDSNCCSYFIDN